MPKGVRNIIYVQFMCNTQHRFRQGPLDTEKSPKLLVLAPLSKGVAGNVYNFGSELFNICPISLPNFIVARCPLKLGACANFFPKL